MADSPLIHTDLNGGQWQATADVIPIVDQSTKLASIRVPLVYRGSRNSLVDKFKFGAKNSPHGGSGMFCLGPTEIRQIPNTGLDPHWDCSVEWMGLHSDVYAAGQGYAFNILLDWSHREAQFPVETSGSTGESRWITPPPPSCAPPGKTTTDSFRRARRLDHMPTANILAVVLTAGYIAPKNAQIAAIMARLPHEGALMSPFENFATTLADTTWVTWAGRPAGTVGGNPSAWFIRTIQASRRIGPDQQEQGAAESIHVLQITATLEQMQQPA